MLHNHLMNSNINKKKQTQLYLLRFSSEQLRVFRSSMSPGRTYGKSSPRLEVRAAEDAFDKLVEDDNNMVEEEEVNDMLQKEENLKAGEENSPVNEASPGLRRSKGRVSR